MIRVSILLFLSALFCYRLAHARLQEDNIEEFGLEQTKTLALTFDDGPGEGTEEILDLLKKYKIKATFFVIGENAIQNRHFLRRIVREGHVLGNHTYSHPSLKDPIYAIHPKKLIAEVKKTHDIIRHFLPKGAKLYFRAPYGDWQPSNAKHLNADKELSQYLGPIYWNAGDLVQRDMNGRLTNAADWDCWEKFMSVRECATGYHNRLDNIRGGVVLSHDIYADTAKMWKILLPKLVNEGYRFVTLDQLGLQKKFKR